MRTLREILDTPIVIEGETGRFINALGGGIETAASWYPMFTNSHNERCHELLNELETLANAPAPDVNAALVANEECQEILAEVKAQNAELRAAQSQPERQLVQFSCTDCHWVTTTFLQVPKCYRCNRADTLVPFHSQKMPELTAREEMERETA